MTLTQASVSDGERMEGDITITTWSRKLDRHNWSNIKEFRLSSCFTVSPRLLLLLLQPKSQELMSSRCSFQS